MHHSLYMILYNKRITKALIRLRGCAGWSAPLLFADYQRQIFSRRGSSYLLSNVKIGQCQLRKGVRALRGYFGLPMGPTIRSCSSEVSSY